MRKVLHNGRMVEVIAITICCSDFSLEKRRMILKIRRVLIMERFISPLPMACIISLIKPLRTHTASNIDHPFAIKGLHQLTNRLIPNSKTYKPVNPVSKHRMVSAIAL